MAAAWQLRAGGLAVDGRGSQLSRDLLPDTFLTFLPTYRFPDGFLWGAATSSHQVEGGNQWNDWWAFEEAGRLPYRSGEACRHYELYERDFDLARALGHNAHRFSIEWSRVEPEDGHWDEGAIAHYRAVVAALRERGIEPVVTLHHFTNPAWLARRGGWLAADGVARFVRYVERMGAELDGVRYWVTINEPTVYTKQSYVAGQWPPQERGAWGKAARVLWAMARAHVAAYRVLHRRADVKVGFAHSAPAVQPCDPRRWRDRWAARLRDFALNDAFIDAIGGRRTLDFLGLNYYTRAIVRAGRRGAALVFGEECPDAHHADRGVISDTGWEVYPAGLRAVLLKFARLGVPLMITENGIATTDETLRSAYLRDHLAVLARTIRDGVDVIGYFHWSLMDNFEWALGTGPRFGLAAVDYATQERTPRPAAALYADICRSNAL